MYDNVCVCLPLCSVTWNNAATADSLFVADLPPTAKRGHKSRGNVRRCWFIELLILLDMGFWQGEVSACSVDKAIEQV